MTSREFRIVIPARFGSTRLPGKPLLDVAGKPLVVHCLENALAAGAHEVVVATDDERIAAVVRAAGGDVQLTRSDHLTGTDRLAEVARARAWPRSDVVVNLQGDEPQIKATHIRQLAATLRDHGRADMNTMAVPIDTVDALFSRDVVKVALDREGYAMYFSRAPIPWVRSAFDPARQAMALPSGVPFLRHIGLYAYRVSTLERLSGAATDPLEAAEQLEQLRALANGLRIHVSVLTEAPPHGVDTPEDLARVVAELGAS